LRDFWYEAQTKTKKYAKERAFRLERHDDLKGFQISVHVKGCVGRIYSTSDV